MWQLTRTRKIVNERIFNGILEHFEWLCAISDCDLSVICDLLWSRRSRNRQQKRLGGQAGSALTICCDQNANIPRRIDHALVDPLFEHLCIESSRCCVPALHRQMCCLLKVGVTKPMHSLSSMYASGSVNEHGVEHRWHRMERFAPDEVTTPFVIPVVCQNQTESKSSPVRLSILVCHICSRIAHPRKISTLSPDQLHIQWTIKYISSTFGQNLLDSIGLHEVNEPFQCGTIQGIHIMSSLFEKVVLLPIRRQLPSIRLYRLDFLQHLLHL
mmetsp:Transcript_2211/g.3555  ORF Transcript_2211/g.3555 Transcript_2211/m.3555 type:complete len:271 (+) Transcript_2211:1804-2616(+)